MKSIFSQSNVDNIEEILSQCCPTKVPTGSTLSSSVETNTLVLFQATLTILVIFTFHSLSSGT